MWLLFVNDDALDGLPQSEINEALAKLPELAELEMAYPAENPRGTMVSQRKYYHVVVQL